MLSPEKERVKAHILSDEGMSEISEMILSGKTYEQIAKHYKITSKTLREWSYKNPQLRRVMLDSHDALIDMVETSLYDTCFPQVYRDRIVKKDGNGQVLEQIQHDKEVAPNINSIKFVLTNRQSTTWKNKQDVTINDDDFPFQLFDDIKAKKNGSQDGFKTDDVALVDTELGLVDDVANNGVSVQTNEKEKKPRKRKRKNEQKTIDGSPESDTEKQNTTDESTNMSENEQK